MVDDEKAGPSLEPPKLFGRRRKAKADPPPAAPDASADVPDAPGDPDAATPPAQAAPVPAGDEPQPLFGDEPVEPVEPAEPAGESTAVAGPEAATGPGAGPEGEPAPAAAPARRRRAGRRSRHTAVIDADRADDVDEAAEPGDDPDEPAGVRRASRPPREEPILTGYRAAAAAGFLAGALAVLLTALTLRLCELVRGTSSCGSPGFVLLVLIFAAVVATGGYLLRYLQIPDPFSTSFLAVGVVAVVALLFLIDVILAWPMIIVIPVLSAVVYVGSTWVTTTFVDPPKD